MTDETRKNIEKSLERWSGSEIDVTQLRMINTTKLMLSNFEKKLAKSKNKKRDIEQLIVGLEMIIERSSSC